MMALQMTGSADAVELGPTNDGLPDLPWLEERLGRGGKQVASVQTILLPNRNSTCRMFFFRHLTTFLAVKYIHA